MAISHLTGHPRIVASFAVLLTSGFVGTLLAARSVWGSPSTARLYLVLWPFFVWWTVALFCLLLAPLLLVVRLVLAVPTNGLLVGGLGVAILSAIMALRQTPRVRAHVISIDGLPAAFEGYRVAQISDLHCGPFASGARVSEWVAAVNRQNADLVAVTGDLIASGSGFVPVVASALGQLKARDGVFASMGNHDYFTGGASMVAALERAGLTVLCNRGVDIERQGNTIHVAGVDDTWTRRADLERTLAERRPGIPVILLAHDPELFPEAVQRGVDLTLSGHTHGGQLGLPFLSRKVNLARLLTPFTTGLYRRGTATLYVNRGLGTTGPPVRLGVPPEIAVFTLRRAVPATVEAKLRTPVPTESSTLPAV